MRNSILLSLILCFSGCASIRGVSEAKFESVMEQTNEVALYNAVSLSQLALDNSTIRLQYWRTYEQDNENYTEVLSTLEAEYEKRKGYQKALYERVLE